MAAQLPSVGHGAPRTGVRAKSLLGGDRHILHCHVCIRRGEQHQGFSSQ